MSCHGWQSQKCFSLFNRLIFWLKRIIAGLPFSFIVLVTTNSCNTQSATFYYSGEINHSNNVELFSSVKNKPVKRIIIKSSGGDVQAGIDLGTYIFDHQLDVEISGYCLSSCANYVFTASKNKFIQKGAIVAWHGNYHHLKETGLWKDDIPLRMIRTGENKEVAERFVYAQMEKLVKVEHEFFNRINVDEKLCWVGKMEPYNALNYYYLSAKDMIRFGVTNVYSEPDYANMDVSRFDENIQYIALEN